MGFFDTHTRSKLILHMYIIYDNKDTYVVYKVVSIDEVRIQELTYDISKLSSVLFIPKPSNKTATSCFSLEPASDKYLSCY